MAALALLSTLGFGVGKWVHNAGSIILLVIFRNAHCAAVFESRSSCGCRAPALKVEIPDLSLLNLTIFTKMAVYALAGFECMAIFAGECHNARRTISRSVMIAAPIIALMYILGTASVLAFVRPDDVDLDQSNRAGIQHRLSPVRSCRLHRACCDPFADRARHCAIEQYLCRKHAPSDGCRLGRITA